MKNSLLRNLVATSAIVTLVGCGSSVDTGYEVTFSSDEEVAYSGDLAVTFTEGDGIKYIDLLEGATVGGEQLSLDTWDGEILVRDIDFAPLDNGFVPRQQDSVLGTASMSPFYLADDGVRMVVDTDLLARSIGLAECGAYPTVTFDVEYIVDVGFDPEVEGVALDGVESGAPIPPPEVEPNTRNLSITIIGTDDTVSGIQLGKVVVGPGLQFSTDAQVLPASSCNQDLTYTIADTSIATVDANGVVTGVQNGSTTLSVASVSNPNVSTEVAVAVSDVSLVLAGESLGEKYVPVCTRYDAPTVLSIEPYSTSATLSGDFEFDWTLDPVDDGLMYDSAVDNAGVGEQAYFTNTLLDGESVSVTATLTSGNLGAVQASDVPPLVFDAIASSNQACDQIPNTSGSVDYATDLRLDQAGAAWAGGAISADASDSIDGTSLKVVSNAEGTVYARQHVWNRVRNFFSDAMGRPATSAGKKYQFATWFKLNQLPADDDVELSFVIIPWQCNGCPGSGGVPARIDNGNTVVLKSTLKQTTEWQYVEFYSNIDTGEMTWQIPQNWSNGPVSDVIPVFMIDGLEVGESVLLDAWSIIELPNTQ